MNIWYINIVFLGKKEKKRICRWNGEEIINVQWVGDSECLPFAPIFLKYIHVKLRKLEVSIASLKINEMAKSEHECR